MVILGFLNREEQNPELSTPVLTYRKSVHLASFSLLLTWAESAGQLYQVLLTYTERLTFSSIPTAHPSELRLKDINSENSGSPPMTPNSTTHPAQARNSALELQLLSANLYPKWPFGISSHSGELMPRSGQACGYVLDFRSDYIVDKRQNIHYRVAIPTAQDPIPRQVFFS